MDDVLKRLKVEAIERAHFSMLGQRDQAKT